MIKASPPLPKICARLFILLNGQILIHMNERKQKVVFLTDFHRLNCFYIFVQNFILHFKKGIIHHEILEIVKLVSKEKVQLKVKCSPSARCLEKYNSNEAIKIKDNSTTNDTPEFKFDMRIRRRKLPSLRKNLNYNNKRQSAKRNNPVCRSYMFENIKII